MRRIIPVVLILGCISVPSAAQDTLRLSLLFTGDIMQHDSQIQAAWNAKDSSYNYQPCFDPVSEILSSADLTIGNLELTFGGRPYKGYPQFSAPDALIHTLKSAGFDVLVTANNHCLDRGKSGLGRTIDVIESAGLMHTGTFKDSVEWLNDHPLILSAKGFRLSLLNYTYGTNGMPVVAPVMVNRIDTARIAADLKRAKEQQTDAIIVFFHWGKEYERLPDELQKQLTEFCFHHGAKLVIGSHPHVLQPMEWRKDQDQLVAYSLGNFVSGQYDRYKNGGALLHVNLSKVVRGDQTSETKIGNAEYSLAYVYRDADPQRSYYILPVEKFEGDSLFVRRKDSRQRLIQFRDDSRELFMQHNLNVSERKKQH